jgi:copper chaperone CopZ
MIVSFCHGRVRLRFKELKDNAVAALAQARIKETAGVTSVEINARTGSLLIEYDERVLPAQKLIETGKRCLEELNIELDIPENLC